MKECPACKKEFSKSEYIGYDPYGFRAKCPHCGARLIKAYGKKLIPLFIALGLFGAYINRHWIFMILTIVVGILIVVVMGKAPYKLEEEMFSS